jgi:nicotinamide mononucleotide transporter
MKKIFGEWSLFEIVWLAAFSGIAFLLSILWKDNLLGFSVFLTGVLCVVLAAKGNIYNYAFGIYNSIGYAWLSYHNGLYGEVFLNLLFFVPTGIAGWIMWKRKTHMGIVEMRRMKWKGIAGTLLLCVAGTVACGLWLSTLQGQNTPFFDAFNVVASVLATLAMMWRYREQWMLYIGINLAETAMWSIRLLNGGADAPTMVVMWAAFLVNSVYGFYNWNKGAKLAAGIAAGGAVEAKGQGI